MTWKTDSLHAFGNIEALLTQAKSGVCVRREPGAAWVWNVAAVGDGVPTNKFFSVLMPPLRRIAEALAPPGVLRRVWQIVLEGAQVDAMRMQLFGRRVVGVAILDGERWRGQRQARAGDLSSLLLWRRCMRS